MTIWFDLPRSLVLSASLITGFVPQDHPNSTAAQPPDSTVKVIADAAVATSDSVSIKGSAVHYRVTVGTQPVWDADNKPIASMFYTYYERTDVADRTTRPLVISFNGGPGSASVWMHIAYTSPRMLRMDSACVRISRR